MGDQGFGLVPGAGVCGPAGHADATLVVGRSGLGREPTLFGRQVVNNLVTRIKVVQPPEAEGQLAELYATAKAQSPIGVVAEILKTMSLRPDFLAAIQAASRMHFTDGALTRAQHEMIASYVSAINRCRY